MSYGILRHATLKLWKSVFNSQEMIMTTSTSNKFLVCLLYEPRWPTWSIHLFPKNIRSNSPQNDRQPDGSVQKCIVKKSQLNDVSFLNEFF